MALFTTADRNAIKSALITAATEGVASVSVGGHAVQQYTLEQLQKLLAMIQADLATDNIDAGSTESRGGLRMLKTIPPAAG
jgi:hypothetical protein